jgi:hypothetical protein
MAVANAIAVAVAATAVAILVAGTLGAGRSATAAPPASVPPAPAAQVPPATPAAVAEGGGVTLHSVGVDLPDSDRTFPGGAGADAVNNNCLACHSAGMVLTQPSLSRATWQAEVDKMRAVYKAPVAAEDVPAIVDYLVRLSGGT